MSFINYQSAQDDWLIPEWVTWICDGEIYSKDWKSTWKCWEVESLDDWNNVVLNITQLSDWFQIRCGFILENWTCWYLSHKQGEVTECPLAKTHTLESQLETKAA